jgi:lipopolysaccharide export system protein LptC
MTRGKQGRNAIAQVLPPSPPSPSRTPVRDWSARQRVSAVQALRYSHFVTFMKGILPIAAVVLLASVVAYSVIPRHSDKFSVTMKSSGNVKNDLTMTKASFTGTDEKGNHFTVTAAEAVQDPRNRHRAELRQVQADMEFDNANWLTATAGLGFIDVDAGTLKLTDGLSVFTDTGYELHTPGADVYIRKNIFEGSQKVIGHGPLGRLSADSFYFDRLKKQVKLTGHVKMRMYPNKAKKR